MADLELREIPVTDWCMIERIGRLRMRAWLTETSQAAEMTTWLDEFDPTARHWAFLRDEQPMAAARLSVHSSIENVPEPEVYAGIHLQHLPTPIASINRLAVDPSVRGMGLSEKLDLVRLQAAEAMKCRCVVGSTSSGVRRVRQLEKWGFNVVGQGNPYSHPPPCYMPPPVIIVCRLPRLQSVNALVEGPHNT